ncbi:hypothetical protein NHG29_01430 [Aerococcaceae bacterium NML160702]|nr:hypothetical protein [Aerococcaceae bacterium NML190073]MCW6681527.1 hypothetical protein [Aerococcaceae bacterium NML160702]
MIIKKIIKYSIVFVLSCLFVTFLYKAQNELAYENAVEKSEPFSVEQIKQRTFIEQIKNAKGHSVLLRTEKIGDDVTVATVRHYARLAETGEITYWTEYIKEEVR